MRRYQAMLDGHAGTDFVEGMLATRLVVRGRDPVGELRTVVGQDFGDLNRRRQLEPAQKIDAAAVGHVAVDVQEHPARGAVNGYAEVAARGLVGHLRQVLDVDVHEALLVVLRRSKKQRISFRPRSKSSLPNFTIYRWERLT